MDPAAIPRRQKQSHQKMYSPDRVRPARPLFTLAPWVPAAPLTSLVPAEHGILRVGGRLNRGLAGGFGDGAAAWAENFRRRSEYPPLHPVLTRVRSCMWGTQNDDTGGPVIGLVLAGSGSPGRAFPPKPLTPDTTVPHQQRGQAHE
jgi:hypothetical protein